MKRSSLVLLLLVLGGTALVYSGAITGEFQFDDETYILEEPRIKQPLGDFFKETLPRAFSVGRPLTQLLFNLNYMAGGFSVEGYHVVNIGLHLLTVAAVWFFARTLFASAMTEKGPEGGADGVALILAAIFALHPLQTESVTYIVQRSEVLASLFYLLGLLSLIKYAGADGIKSAVFWSLGMFFFVLGWWSKEIIVTMPVVFILYAAFFMDRRRLIKAVFAMAPFLIGGVYLGIRMTAEFSRSSHVGFAMKGLGQPEYFYTQLGVMLTYLRLIFLPVGQNFDHDYPVYSKISSLQVAGPMLVWAVIVVFCFLTLRVRGGWMRHMRVAGFGMLWFLVLLLPTSSVVPLKDVIFEHRVYLPMFGALAAAVSLADMLRQRASEKYGAAFSRASVAVAVVIALALGMLTYQRNLVWQTKLSLWQDVVSKSPDKSRGHNNLGNCYYLQGDYEAALREYKLAVDLGPDFLEAYYNAGMLLEKLGRPEEAAYYYLYFAREAPPEYDRLKKDILNRYGLQKQ